MSDSQRWCHVTLLPSSATSRYWAELDSLIGHKSYLVNVPPAAQDDFIDVLVLWNDKDSGVLKCTLFGVRNLIKAVPFSLLDKNLLYVTCNSQDWATLPTGWEGDLYPMSHGPAATTGTTSHS